MKYGQWLLSRIKRQLWWQAILFGILGITTALVATVSDRFFPWTLPFEVSREAVDSLLNVIASSMLAVTTFSLGAVTSAFGAATNNVTPRATKLLMEDKVTHNVLSTFIGAFIFSIVGLIVLRTGSYGDEGRAVLFVITIGVIALIVAQLLRWINHLLSLGRVSTTIERVEDATRLAITTRLSVPYLGANPWRNADTPPENARAIRSKAIGYLQFADIEALSRLCEEHALTGYIPLYAEAFCYEGTVLMYVVGPFEDELYDTLLDQFVIASTRTFDQDPRFGLAVMAEVASRALSPATNDPGTALDVIGRQTRLLAQWGKGRDDVPVDYPRLYVSPIAHADLFEDAFMLPARDGAHLIEIQLRLQKSLTALQQSGSPAFRAAARQQAEMAYQRAKLALTAPCDIERIEREAGSQA